MAIALLLALPTVASADPAGTITEYSAGLNTSPTPILVSLTAGSDGNVWFIDRANPPSFGKINPTTHAIEEFLFSENGANPGVLPISLTAGPDGNLWFTDNTVPKSIGTIDPITHAITEYGIEENGGNAISVPQSITTGPDGNLWFIDNAATKSIGKINPTTHAITEYPVVANGGNAGTSPASIVAGSDGNLWFTDNGSTKAVGKITTSGAVTEYSSGLNAGVNFTSKIDLGPDGNVWFGDRGTTPALGRVTPSGTITEFSAGLNAGARPESIAAGPDGNVWFADRGTTKALGRVTPSGTITEFSAGLNAGSIPNVAASGPAGEQNVWFLDTGTTKAIGKVGTQPPQTLTVTKTGAGSGTVTSSPSGINCGTECSKEYTAGTEVTLTASADEGSVLKSWTGCESEPEGKCVVTMSAAKEVTAEFGLTSNHRTLTLTKSGNGPGGLGSISSKPKGIKCGANCTEAVASMFKETAVVLTEKPGKNSTFVEWTGDCSGSSPTCTLPMAEDESVGAVFSTGTSEKVLSPAEALTVSKGESTGQGTVKGTSGLGCEAECTQTVVLYQGPITGEKPKPGKTVTLKQAPAFGSEFTGWTGCDSEPVVEGSTQCVVEMDEAHLVTAEYTALPNKVLTLNKPYSSGNGSVASKPKGIKCATACTQAVANMPEGAKVELTAKPGKETLFVEWVGGDCNGSTSPICLVTMNTNETTEAVFNKGGKAFLEGSEPTLTLAKAGSGLGMVKGTSGLACEVLCTKTLVLYQGPVLLPHPKPGKLVTLKATSAPGSKPVQWTGCDTEPVVEAEVQCVVTMEASREVTAKFSELE